MTVKRGIPLSVALAPELDAWVTLFAEQRAITRADAARELLWASLYMSSAYATATEAAARANHRSTGGLAGRRPLIRQEES